MRFDGKLEKWEDDRGFGFIAPLQGGELVFVHVSAFPRGGRRPEVGEPLTFEVEPGGDGRKRAVRVQRPRQRPTAPAEGRRRASMERRGSGRPLHRIVVALILVGLGGYAYTQFASSGFRTSVATPGAMDETPRSLRSNPPAAAFRCDGRTHCSQMTSCEQARFFLQNCPGTKMDGDGDGIPCEAQWCQ